jgi:hypothetical protein
MVQRLVCMGGFLQGLELNQSKVYFLAFGNENHAASSSRELPPANRFRIASPSVSIYYRQYRLHAFGITDRVICTVFVQ